MKQKKTKKLSFAKITVADLRPRDMEDVKGGCAYSAVMQSCYYTEYTCIENCPFTYYPTCITEIIECIKG